LGCVTAVPGYFEAIKAVCDRHGALLIFDEVICGMGRTGTLHAWEQEGVVPDIQAVGKGLASGYGVISAVLVNERVVSALRKGSGYFAHGQTYQTHPLSCAAALEVQQIIREEKLLDNVRRMGMQMESLLKKRLAEHPHVGEIRGRGLFWGLEFVADKATKEPFDPELQVSKRLHNRGLKKGYDISLFPATGCADGWRGDQIWLAPPYTVQKQDVEEIVNRLGRVVDDVFKELLTTAC
jgi:adenosylmethionine-8-amino-7-oxononanoate aminotransferase